MNPETVETGASPDDLSAWKAQQEANRAARLQQLHTPAELWQIQQKTLGALAKLRPDVPKDEVNPKPES